MRGLTGLTLVIAGAAAAIYGYYPDAESRQAALARGVGSVEVGWFDSAGSGNGSTSTDLPLVVVDAERRAFSPQSPLFQQVPHAGAVLPRPPAAAASVGNATTATSHSQALSGSAAAQTGLSADVEPAAAVTDFGPAPSPVVTHADRNPASPRSGITSAKPGGEHAHRELTRDLQKELKRVGCYDGEINGSWSPASRRAMKAFTDRVNATLPIEEPDYILLTLVQGHSAEACGVGCPADQMLAKDGKCQPRAIVAQAANKSAKRNAPPKVAAVKPEARSSIEPKLAAKTPEKSAEVGRALEMWAKVTPPPGAGTSGHRAMSAGGWQTATISAQPTPGIASAVQPAPALAPLPGRMAIGGPVSGSTVMAAAHGVSDVRAVTSPAAEPAPSSVGVESPEVRKSGQPEASGARRLPRHVVDAERSRPRRVKSYDSFAPAHAPRPVQPSKSARVRNMHYNLFTRPDRVTN